MNKKEQVFSIREELEGPDYVENVPSRPTKAIIDLKTYRENMIMIKQKVKRKVMAIVKANAYGHGLTAISKEAEDIVDFFGVAVLEEAKIIREAGIEKPILVLGYVEPVHFNFVISNDIRVNLYSLEQWKEWEKLILNCNLEGKLKFHLKINSGMNRLGFINKLDIERVMKEIEQNANAEIEGIFTHFSTADIPGDSFIDEQENNFLDLTAGLNMENKVVHIANSAYTLARKEPKLFDMVRVGISGYGLLPDHSLEKDMVVKTNPILQLSTKVVHIQHLNKGDKVGYGGTYVASGKERVGIIPIGYADGLLRRYAKNSYVLINGEKRYFAGRICMDQAMILLKEEDKLGDEVMIYGKQGDQEITLEMAGDWSDTNNYEVACLISNRVKRNYIK